MKESKICHGDANFDNSVKMECNDNYCESKHIPELKFEWMQSITNSYVICEMFTKRIVAEKYNSKLLLAEPLFSSCTPIDHVCQLKQEL